MSFKLSSRKYNAISSLFFQFTAIISGLLLPYFLLNIYGSEVNGLISTIIQYLAVFAMIDLGLGALISTAYYKSLAEKDTKRTSNIYTFTNGIYRIFGFILIVYVLILTLILPRMIESSFSMIYVSTLVLSISLSQFFQYFFGISNQMLLNSNQQGYINFFICGITNIINIVLTIILMKNNVDIQIVKLSTSIIYIIRPIVLYYAVKHNFKYLKKTKFNINTIKNKKSGISQHISYIIYTSTDVIVLSTFSTLLNVSIYTVFNSVIINLTGIINSLFVGMLPYLGHSFHINKEKYINDLKKYWVSIHFMSIVFFGLCIFVITPFINLYTQGIENEMYLDFGLAVLMIIMGYLVTIRESVLVLVKVENLYKKITNYSLIEAFLNIILSILLVKLFGVKGVVIGTICASTCFILLIFLGGKIEIDSKLKNFFVKITCLDIFIIIILAIFRSQYTFNINNFFDLVVFSIIYLALIILIVSIFYYLFIRDEFINLIKIKKIT